MCYSIECELLPLLFTLHFMNQTLFDRVPLREDLSDRPLLDGSKDCSDISPSNIIEPTMETLSAEDSEEFEEHKGSKGEIPGQIQSGQESQGHPTAGD